LTLALISWDIVNNLGGENLLQPLRK